MNSKNNTVSILLSTCAFIISINCMIISPNAIRQNTVGSVERYRDSLMNFTRTFSISGYISEEHIVETEDGYLLKIFRVIKARNCKTKLRSPPVILAHGLLQSSDVFWDAGPDAGLAYLISDACYDLWLTNQRGNYYGRSHRTLNPDKDPEFWQFSVDEMGYYDTPATVDYVLNYTKSQKLNYVGYSQGCITFFIMCSERPGYCEKTNVYLGLSPPAQIINLRSILLRLFSYILAPTWRVFNAFGIYEIFGVNGILYRFLSVFCSFSVISTRLCKIGLYVFDAYNPGSITDSTSMVLFKHFPAGSSVQLMARYAQYITYLPGFGKMDFGVEQNLVLYGSTQPPSYNLSAVTVPVMLLHGDNDHIVATTDVIWLTRQLPNVLEFFRVEDPLWTHFDIAYSQRIKEMIFPKINEYLTKYSYVN